MSSVKVFAETVLRWPESRRDVLWSDVEARRGAEFVVLRDLVLAQLHGPGPAAFGLKPGDLTGEDYDPFQAVSAIIHADPACDGIRYRSRFQNDLFCIALFERAGAAVELVREGVPIERDWTFDLLKASGYTLVDL